MTHSQNIKSKILNKRKQNTEKINGNLMETINYYQKTENVKSKLRLKNKKNILSNKRAQTQTNLSSNNLTKSYSSNKNQESFKLLNIDDKNVNSYSNFFKDKICFCGDKEENYKIQNNSMRIPLVMYNKKFELIRYRDLSFDNKLEKYLTNFLGIYNTKREKSKKIMDYRNSIKAKKRMKNFDRKNLIFSNFIKDHSTRKPRVMSAYTSLKKNKTINDYKNDNNKDILSIMKYLDKSRKNELFKN